MLHFVFQSPIEIATLDRMEGGDVVVFFENSLYRLLKVGTFVAQLQEKTPAIRFCVLGDDLAVRGIAPAELARGLEVIDYAELVGLTVANPAIQSWL